MFFLFLHSNLGFQVQTNIAYPCAKWFCLVLACFSFGIWSQELPQDDGTCDISDFLCPAPDDLSFNLTNELSCHSGQGHGSMSIPNSQQLCQVSTFRPNDMDNGHLCAADQGQLCGVIRCPYGCYPDGASPQCHCYARWRFCYEGAGNQSVTPDSCVSVCAYGGSASEKCNATPTPTTPTHGLLNPLELGLIIAAGITVVIITVTCVAGVGRYYLRRHYQLRYRDYQPFPGGADIAPPKM